MKQSKTCKSFYEKLSPFDYITEAINPLFITNIDQIKLKLNTANYIVNELI